MGTEACPGCGHLTKVYADAGDRSHHAGCRFEERTPAEWCDELGVVVMDPDGWDRQAADWEAEWARPLTREEFERRLNRSTVRRR